MSSISMLFFLLTSCGKKEVETTPENVNTMPLSAEQLAQLKLDTVKLTNEVSVLKLNGIISFNQDEVANVFPLVSGHVNSVRVSVGDYVTKGQILATVQSGDVSTYQNQYNVAVSNVAMTKKNLDVAQELYKTNVYSDKDLITAQNDYKAATANLDMVSQYLKIFGATAGKADAEYKVSSPIDGYVVQKNLNEGMDIRPDNGNNLFTISDLKDVWVLANVYESNIADVHLGDSVEVKTLAYPDRSFHGKIDKVLNVLDPVNKVMKVRISLPNADYALKPSMFASVTITKTENTKMLCVPSDAIVFDNSQNYVLVYKDKSTILIQPVKVATTFGNKTFIESGLKEGDKVVGSQTLLIYQALNG